MVFFHNPVSCWTIDLLTVLWVKADLQLVTRLDQSCVHFPRALLLSCLDTYLACMLSCCDA